MEYAKDITLDIQYEDKPEKKKFWSGKYAWIHFMVVVLTVLTVVDAILMIQFYEVLKEL